jgi:hypothetical protein
VTKFYLTVCLPALAPAAMLPALTAAVAPFDMNDYQHDPYDPNATWDWWTLNMRDALILRPEYVDDPRQLRAPAPPEGSGAVVAAPKFMVDFDSIRGAARQHAAEAWDAWAELANAYPGTLPRSHFRTRLPSREEADREHLSQPAVQAVAKAAVSQTHPYFTFAVLLADPVTHFAQTCDIHVRRAAEQAFVTHAYLTVDGHWCSELTKSCMWEEHAQAMTEYLESLPEDSVLAVIACHC